MAWEDIDPRMKAVELTAQALAEEVISRCRHYGSIQCKIGETVDEVKRYLIDKHGKEIGDLIAQGKRVGIYRRNPLWNYQTGNIDIEEKTTARRLEQSRALTAVSNKERLGIKVVATYPDGTKEFFNSMTEAGKLVGINSSTVGGYIKRGTVHKPSGIRFTRGI